MPSVPLERRYFNLTFTSPPCRAWNGYNARAVPAQTSRFKLLLAYDGTAYSGWQVQPGANTIQARLGEALSRMAKREIKATAAGRTDAGVHALGQTAHFDLEHRVPPEGLVKGLNSMLPLDIRVRAATEVDSSFHARKSARSKIYRYHLDRSDVSLPFRNRFAHHYPHPLERAALEEAAALFVGEHDFAGFRAASCNAKTTVRNVLAASFVDEGCELVFEIRADAFLQHMVRNIVGTLLEVGRGKRTPASIAALLERGDRKLAGPTAPPQGLHLIEVFY